MAVNIIVAIDRKGGIGRGGDLLFHISADLRHFKALTLGHTVIMGRKTFDSLPKGALPGRRNIVVTRNRTYTPAGADVAHSLREAIAMSQGEIFIIGGAQIYTQALPFADRLCITLIDAEAPDADTFFPTIPLHKYHVTKVESTESQPKCKFIELNKY